MKQVILLGVGVLALVVGAGALGYVMGGQRLQADVAVPAHPLTVPADADAVAEGERLATLFGCVSCHAPDLGGQVLIDAPPMGVIPAPNLTRGAGGVGGDYTVEDWERALRHGVNRRGRGMIIMPSADYAGLSDEDLGRLLAYLTTVPPVDRRLPRLSAGPVARMLVLTGGMQSQPDLIDHAALHPAAVAPAVTPDYGGYLVRVCAGCHGPDLAGGISLEPGAPPSANLTPAPDGLGAWALEDFVRAMREGRRPDGSEIDASMPWRYLARYTDAELEAMWLHLSALDPVPTPER